MNTGTTVQDQGSLIRLTITESPKQTGIPHNPLLFGGQLQNNDVPLDWDINGYIKPSPATPITASLQVVVTEYGRVRDGCNAAALGPALRSRTPLGGGFGGGFGGFNPFLNFGSLGGNFLGGLQRPAGHLTNPLLVTQGGMTIYSSRIHGVSRSQLLGAGMGVCQAMGHNDECQGMVLLCCTIAKDQLPGSRMYLQPALQGVGNAVGIPGVGINSGFPVPGVGVGVGVSGIGLGGSIPFEMDSSNVLAFTDPNAALNAASNDANTRNQVPAQSSSSSSSSSNSGSTSEGLF